MSLTDPERAAYAHMAAQRRKIRRLQRYILLLWITLALAGGVIGAGWWMLWKAGGQI